MSEDSRPGYKKNGLCGYQFHSRILHSSDSNSILRGSDARNLHVLGRDPWDVTIPELCVGGRRRATAEPLTYIS